MFLTNLGYYIVERGSSRVKSGRILNFKFQIHFSLKIHARSIPTMLHRIIVPNATQRFNMHELNDFSRCADTTPDSQNCIEICIRNDNHISSYKMRQTTMSYPVTLKMQGCHAPHSESESMDTLFVIILWLVLKKT